MKATAWGRLIIAIPAFALLSFVLAFLYWNSEAQMMQRLNEQNFQRMSLWKPYGGAWQVSSGLVRNNSDDRGSKLLAGNSTWQNYSFTSELLFDTEHGDMGVIVRASHPEEGVDSYDGYYVGLRAVDGMLVAGRSDFGWIEVRPIAMPGGVHAGRWYRISVTAVGCHIAAMAENLSTGQRAYIAVKDDDCLRNGQIGIRSFATGGTWRDLHVRPSVIDEYDKMEALAGGLHSLELPRREADYNRNYHFSSSASIRPASAQNGEQGVPEIHIAETADLQCCGAHRVRFNGVVTLSGPELYVQDSEGASELSPCATFSSTSAIKLKWMDGLHRRGLVEVLGMHRCVCCGPAHQCRRSRLRPAQAASGAYEAKFVETEALLRKQIEEPNGDLILELSSDSQDFRAALSARIAHAMPRIEERSLLRIRGICVLDPELTRDLTPFVLLPRSANDVQVVSAAPWWTPWHVGLYFVLTIALIVAAQMGYYRVHQWRAQAVTQERERLAHEIHDTMAQSFAGVGYQIQGIRSRVLKGEPLAQQQIADQLGVAYQLVRRCHEEASGTIAMLGTMSPEVQNDLLGSLRATAQRIAGGPILVNVSVEGSVYPLDLRCANSLQMIGQEAISNALGHGDATALDLILHDANARIEMTIQDNGKGFETGRKYAGIGVLGMQKRARDVGGTLNIASIPGTGTTVKVTVPVLKRRGFKNLDGEWFAYLGSRLRNRLLSRRRN